MEYEFKYTNQHRTFSGRGPAGAEPGELPAVDLRSISMPGKTSCRKIFLGLVFLNRIECSGLLNRD
jgi:hypothetical protein